jgi:hypothetical protein
MQRNGDGFLPYKKIAQIISGHGDMKGIQKAKEWAISYPDLLPGATDFAAAKMVKAYFRRQGRGISLTLHKKFRVC